MAGVVYYLDACRKPNQIVGVGQWVSFVEVIYTPGEPALRIAPGAEAVGVQIAISEDVRRITQISADLRPYLGPAVKRSPKKHEQIGFHLLVF